MTKREIAFMAMATFFGFVGGLAATYVFSPEAVTAQVGERFPLRTTGLTIVTDSGEPRVSLKLWDGEHPVLMFSDARCERRASLMVAPRERAALTLFGENCKRRVALELQADDLPSFVLRDSNDVPRARLHLLKDGKPVLALYGANGKLIESMP